MRQLGGIFSAFLRSQGRCERDYKRYRGYEVRPDCGAVYVTLRQDYSGLDPHTLFLMRASSYTQIPVTPERTVICSADDTDEV